MALPDSQLQFAIASDANLRLRVETLTRKRINASTTLTSTERVLAAGGAPITSLCFAIATNPTVFANVKAALPASGDGVAAAIEAAASDSDLDFIIVQQLPSLADPA